MTSEYERENFQQIAHKLADISGDQIIPYFRKNLEVQNKSESSEFDPVTLADKNAEQIMRQFVEKKMPEHGIIGEEFEDKAPADQTNQFQWVFDPIDGTRAFISGFPIWGTLIGLLHNGGPVLGLMNQPFTGERFWAQKDFGAFYRHNDNTRPLTTRNCPQMSNAILACTPPNKPGEAKINQLFRDLPAKAKLTRYGGDCYSYCLLASGQVDLVIESNLKIYDIAPLIPIIESAGGRVTDWNGQSAVNGGNIVAAGCPELHEEALELLEGYI